MTTALWTTAAPSPAVWTWLQFEKSPDSNPSLKTVFVAAVVVNFTVEFVHEIVPTLSPRPPICSSYCVPGVRPETSHFSGTFEADQVTGPCSGVSVQAESPTLR